MRKTKKYLSKKIKKVKRRSRRRRYRGGAKPSVISFNILNPEFVVTKITFGNLMDNILASGDNRAAIITSIIGQDGKDKPKFSDIIGMADQQRYLEWREGRILTFLNENASSIFFLQEVSKPTLDKITSHTVIANTEGDILKIPKIWKGSFQGYNDFSRQEFRAILLPKGIQPVEQKDLVLMKGLEDQQEKIVRKNGVHVKVSLDGVIVNLINVHLYYEFDQAFIQEKLTAILGSLGSEPVIIGGDMNKSLTELGFLTESGFSTNQDETPTFINTGGKIPISPDHILAKQLAGTLTVIEDYGGQILYDEQILSQELLQLCLSKIDIIKTFDSRKPPSAEVSELINQIASMLPRDKYISDHKPIKFEFTE